MKGKLVVGNWKMNGDRARNQALLGRLRESRFEETECVVCVPFPYLAQAEEMLAGTSVRVGAQNVSEFSCGAHTGEVSAAMLADFSVRYVIVGHSERRTMHGETDDIVARKAGAALSGGLTPIVCVGETLAEREAGEAERVLRRQLEALAEMLGSAALAKVVLAYEPVWAIGTGRAASVEQVQAMLAYMRAWLATRVSDPACVRVLYGGSVKTDGAAALFALPDCDGGLVGGASLEASQFLGICRAAASVSRIGEV